MPPLFAMASCNKSIKKTRFVVPDKIEEKKKDCKQWNKDFENKERELNEQLRAMRYSAQMRNVFGLEKPRAIIRNDVYYV